jgi:hypothetical protein
MIKVSDQNNMNNNIPYITKVSKIFQNNICGQYVPEVTYISPVGKGK